MFSFLTRFLFFGEPQSVVFDEVYFGKFARDYLTKGSFF
ncbi:MAG: phospholipid carrier-dependent glycosyltransferase [Patescibacteria group bacterium]